MVRWKGEDERVGDEEEKKEGDILWMKGGEMKRERKWVIYYG